MVAPRTPKLSGKHVRVKGMQRVQNALLQTARAVSPSQGLLFVVSQVGAEVLDFGRAATHVDTGTLSASHRIDTKGGAKSARATIFIDPTAINPVSGQRPAQYGVVEHARGGSHAFYEQTVNVFRSRRGQRFIMDQIRKQLPR